MLCFQNDETVKVKIIRRISNGAYVKAEDPGLWLVQYILQNIKGYDEDLLHAAQENCHNAKIFFHEEG